MHISPFYDAGFAYQVRSERALGRAHRDGLVRGLLFLAAIAVPFALAIATGQAGHSDPSAGYAQTFDAGSVEARNLDSWR